MNRNRYIILGAMIVIMAVSVFYIDAVCSKPTEHIKPLPRTVEQVKSATITVAEVPEVPQYNIPLSEELQVFTYAECEKRKLSYEMVLAIMWTESKMDITAVNYNSDDSVDGGILQINSNTADALAQEIGIENFEPSDPYTNIQVGVYYLSILRDNFSQEFSDEDTFSTVCVAYNRGGNNTMRSIKQHGFSFVANNAYAQTVSEYKYQLETTGTFIDYVKE